MESFIILCEVILYIGHNIHDVIATYAVSVFLFGVLKGAFYKVLVQVTGWLTAAELEDI